MIGGTAAINYVQLPHVTIGNQIWSTKNLDVARYRNGDPIPEVQDQNQWNSLTMGAWCWYNNDSATFASKYGRLYNWFAVTDPRGLAPTGWHIATDDEWNLLLQNFDSSLDTTCTSCYQSSIAGGFLKEMGFTHWISPNTGSNNYSGFTALPGGARDYTGAFNYLGYVGFWWAVKSSGSPISINRRLFYNNAGIQRNVVFSNQIMSDGYSVRLVRNN
jgi:uncharacterized protein (TIGR02145 family)